jgi:hypothetical protein
MMRAVSRESVPCDVPGCSHDGTAWSYVSITLPGGIPVPTFTVCQQCMMGIIEGE